eukprot:scaffold1484_cov241-Pinguiococcus_pyrenoidosus.AAC.2
MLREAPVLVLDERHEIASDAQGIRRCLRDLDDETSAGIEVLPLKKKEATDVGAEVRDTDPLLLVRGRRRIDTNQVLLLSIRVGRQPDALYLWNKGVAVNRDSLYLLHWGQARGHAADDGVAEAAQDGLRSIHEAHPLHLHAGPAVHRTERRSQPRYIRHLVEAVGRRNACEVQAVQRHAHLSKLRCRDAGRKAVDHPACRCSGAVDYFAEATPRQLLCVRNLVALHAHQRAAGDWSVSRRQHHRAYGGRVVVR